MAGRPRLDIGTFGTITTSRLGPGRVRAESRYRDDDGRVRKVTATGRSRNDATAALKRKLTHRPAVGDTGSSLTPASPFPELARQWLESVQLDPELAQGTKDVYARALRSLLMPTFTPFTIREITVARVERFLKVQRSRSYGRAKLSKSLLSLVMAFAIRHEAIQRNPVTATSPLRKPPPQPKALTAEEVARIRAAARSLRAEPGRHGPRPDGQVRDLIEVMLGSAARIGEALALRKCDIDLDADPATISVTDTIVVRKGKGKGKGVYRQPFPKRANSNRTVAVPAFVADVLRSRLALVETDDDEHLLFFTRRHTALYPHNVRRTFRESSRWRASRAERSTPTRSVGPARR